MNSGLRVASGGARVLLVNATSVAFAVLAVLVSTAPAFGAGGQAAVPAALAALLLAFAALARARARSLVLAVSAPGSTRPTHDEVPAVQQGRATDPGHHPLRPRAPGTA